MKKWVGRILIGYALILLTYQLYQNFAPSAEAAPPGKSKIVAAIHMAGSGNIWVYLENGDCYMLEREGYKKLHNFYSLIAD